MIRPVLVETGSTGTVAAQAAIKHLCPFEDEADTGSITITWACRGFTIELHSLAEYLAVFTDVSISHEDLVSLIGSDLQDLGDGIAICSVAARFTTAGIDVEVRRGPVHVDAAGA